MMADLTRISNQLGRPAYHLVNDSNVSWKEGLPAVALFVREQQLPEIKIEWASLSDPALVVPEAQIWDCQAPTDRDVGHWVAVTAVSILESQLRVPRAVSAPASRRRCILRIQTPDAHPTCGHARRPAGIIKTQNHVGNAIRSSRLGRQCPASPRATATRNADVNAKVPTAIVRASRQEGREIRERTGRM
jgi:hypothetical protein